VGCVNIDEKILEAFRKIIDDEFNVTVNAHIDEENENVQI
jgi:hypothetical protein